MQTLKKKEALLIRIKHHVLKKISFIFIHSSPPVPPEKKNAFTRRNLLFASRRETKNNLVHLSRKYIKKNDRRKNKTPGVGRKNNLASFFRWSCPVLPCPTDTMRWDKPTIKDSVQHFQVLPKPTNQSFMSSTPPLVVYGVWYCYYGTSAITMILSGTRETKTKTKPKTKQKSAQRRSEFSSSSFLLDHGSFLCSRRLQPLLLILMSYEVVI